jgi:hypothetical protein
MKILLLWLYIYNGGDSFGLVFKLYGDINLLEINA